VVNKIISLVLFGIWFKLFNVFFYSFFDVPVEFVTGSGMNMFKIYWLFLFAGSTTLAFKSMSYVFRLSYKRVE